MGGGQGIASPFLLIRKPKQNLTLNVRNIFSKKAREIQLQWNHTGVIISKILLKFLEIGKCMCSITNVSSHQAVSLTLKCPDLWAPYIPKNWTPTRIEVVSGNKISLAVGIKDLFSQNQSLSHVIWLCLPNIRISFSCEALSWSICVDLEKPTVLLWQRGKFYTPTPWGT